MKSGDRLIRLIAIFKLFKAALLIALGIGAFRPLHRDLRTVIEHWIEIFNLDQSNRFIDTALEKVATVSPSQITKLGLGSFVYAGLFLTEGIGLWLMKHWAEWLTTIITGSLIPFKIYEIYRHPSAVKIGVLALNVAIVAYLIHHIRTRPAA